MAEITQVPFELDRETLKGGLGADWASQPARSAGLHVSDIIRDIDNTVINRGKRVKYDHLSDEEKDRMHRYAEMGFMWEVIIEEVFKQRMLQRMPVNFIRQEEVEKDGIYMTIDGFDPDTWTLHEYKLTWKSMSRATTDIIESEFWAWFSQMKAYCYAMNCTKARLFVFWVNGNYKPPIPQTCYYDIEFLPIELEDNWRLLTNHAEALNGRN